MAYIFVSDNIMQVLVLQITSYITKDKSFNHLKPISSSVLWENIYFRKIFVRLECDYANKALGAIGHTVSTGL